MISGGYNRLDVWKPGRVERRAIVRVGKSEESKIIVTIKTSTRGKDGKIKYETVESIDVFEAQPTEVKEAVLRGLAAASQKK